MTSPAQFRPGPPPPLTSVGWARDYNEIKALGGKNSTRRTAEQTEVSGFWEATLPPIYHGVVRSVAAVPGREVTQNARLFMAETQATDDAHLVGPLLAGHVVGPADAQDESAARTNIGLLRQRECYFFGYPSVGQTTVVA
jgi:hypothetical protein